MRSFTLYLLWGGGRCGQRGLWPPHSRSFSIPHNDAPQSTGLLWTSDQLVAETSAWQHTTLKTNIHASGGIPTRNPNMLAASDLRLSPRGHWDRLHDIAGELSEENRTCYRGSAWKPEGKTVGKSGLDWSGSRYGEVVGFCEHSTEPYSSLKCWEFLV